MKEKVHLTASGKRDHRYGKRPASVGKNISKGLTASWARRRAEHPPLSEEERKRKRRERDRIMRERKRGGRPLKRPGRPRGHFKRKRPEELESLRWRTYSAPSSKISVLVKIGQSAKQNNGLAIVLEEKATKKEVFSLFSGNHARQDIHSLEEHLKELSFSRIEVKVKTRKTVREMIEEAEE